MQTISRYVLIMFVLGLVACTPPQKINHTRPMVLIPSASIALFPFTNMTETPQADGRAASITESLLQIRGFTVKAYPTSTKEHSFLPGMRPVISMQKLIAWAAAHHVSYAMTGTVNEWRYKVGLDGEPVVGLSLQLLNIDDGHVMWTAVASKSGNSREALTTVAQTLIKDMLSTLITP